MSLLIPTLTRAWKRGATNRDCDLGIFLVDCASPPQRGYWPTRTVAVSCASGVQSHDCIQLLSCAARSSVQIERTGCAPPRAPRMYTRAAALSRAWSLSFFPTFAMTAVRRAPLLRPLLLLLLACTLVARVSSVPGLDWADLDCVFTGREVATPMVPFMESSELALFRKYLVNSRVFFETGSGGSTYEAVVTANVMRIISIEGDSHWIQKMADNVAVRRRDSAPCCMIARPVNAVVALRPPATRPQPAASPPAARRPFAAHLPTLPLSLCRSAAPSATAAYRCTTSILVRTGPGRRRSEQIVLGERPAAVWMQRASRLRLLLLLLCLLLPPCRRSAPAAMRVVGAQPRNTPRLRPRSLGRPAGPCRGRRRRPPPARCATRAPCGQAGRLETCTLAASDARPPTPRRQRGGMESTAEPGPAVLVAPVCWRH